MLTPLLLLLLPAAFLIHDIEEIIMRKRWMNNHAHEVMQRFPRTIPLVSHLKAQSTRAFCYIVIEELLLIILSAVCMMYVSPLPIAALAWAFIVHLWVHLGLAVALRRYVPGLVTALLLQLPYTWVVIWCLTQEFSAWDNLLLATSGTLVVAINIVIMHKLIK